VDDYDQPQCLGAEEMPFAVGLTRVRSDMSTLPHPFLKTKLMPPKLGSSLLERPRLLDRLRNQIDLPMTIVTANAGCGKTTLVNEFVRRAQTPYVWYQIDPTELDLGLFFAYMVHGMRRANPEFGGAVLGYIRETDDLWSKAEQLADVFLNEVFERIEEKTIIVLDDFHHVDGSEAICTAMDRMLKYLPDVLHIVVTTRTMPNLSVTRLKSKGMVGIVDRQELLFTQQEVEQLFARIFERELPDELISQLHLRTEGWITALQLVQQSLERSARSGRNAGASDNLIVALKQSEADIFDYFAEEVLEDEAPEVRLLLGQLSLVDRIDPAMYEGALQKSGVREELRSFSRRNVFLTNTSAADAEEEYRLHPLFKAFLQRWLKGEIGQDGIKQMHRTYGDWYCQTGRWDAALHHYSQVADELAADVLAEHSPDLIRMGGHQAVKSAFDGLPRSLFATRPAGLNARADIALREGDRPFAHTLYERAAAIGRDTGDEEVLADALRGLAYIARYSGDSGLAVELAQSALAISQASGGIRARCFNVIGLCRFAAHEVSGAIQSWQSALGEARAAGDERFARVVLHNLGLPYSLSGEFDEALRWLSQIATNDPGQGPMDPSSSSPFPQETIGFLNIGRLKIVQGKLDEAEISLERALDRSRMFNMRTTAAETLEGFGNLYRERGDYNRALAFYDEASRAYREEGLPLTDPELLDERATLFLYMGRLADAEADAELYWQARMASGPAARSTALITRGRIQTAAGRPAQAEESLREAIELASQSELHYNEARALTSLARLLLTAGRASEGMVLMEQAKSLSALYEYSFWIAQEASRCPDLLRPASADDLGSSRQSVPLLPRVDVPPTPVPDNFQDSVKVVFERQTYDLSIGLMGSVSVCRSKAEPMPPDAWRLAKSLHILCYVASRPNRRARKDRLIEAFWPDGDPDTIAKNFHPTISHLRKALNSGQVLKKDFILYREGAYYLNPLYEYQVDIEEFDTRLSMAREAERNGDPDASAGFLSDAIRIYRGEFLEDLYYDWVEEQRNYYQDLYLDALGKLLSYNDQQRDYGSAVRYGQMILSRDPYREDIHCRVMEAHARSGNRAAAVEQYEILKKTLKLELGVAPLPATVARYESLLK
jgi:LuxR family maltose regulon positive regulatory protein